MQESILFSLLIICIGAIVVAGCTSTGSTNATAQATTIPTPAIQSPVVPNSATLAMPTNETTIPTAGIATVNATPDATPDVISPYPSDVSKITFTQYKDSDFNVEYPSDWRVSTSSYTGYYCQNDLSCTSSTYHICYQNETKSIGPFDFYSLYWDNNQYQPTARVVTFTSPDGNIEIFFIYQRHSTGFDGRSYN